MPVSTNRPALAVTTALSALTLSLCLADAVASSGWVREWGLDVWNYPKIVEMAEREKTRRWEIETGAEVVSVQVVESTRIVCELIDGRVSLAVAVADLELINQNRTGFVVSLGCTYQECVTFHARVARWAIDQVRVRLKMEGDYTRIAETVARLEGEFATTNWTGCEPETSRPREVQAVI